LSRKALSIVLLMLILLPLSFQPLVLAAKFNLGDTVEVFNTDASGLLVRDAPAGNIIGKKYDGDRGMILDGPRSASLGGVVYTWWKVRWGDDALEGWSAEGYPGGVDYLKKISVSPSTKFSIGDLVKVSTGGASLIVRTDPPPNSDLSYKGSVADGTVGKIIGGPFYGVPKDKAGFYHFWKVDYLSIVGWSAEDWLTKVVGEPVITSSLVIIPSKTDYYVGETITAEYTITNRANAPFTFDVLTVGGRDPDNQVADFTWRTSITLNPDESYNYQGTLTLTKIGNYHFFCAYRTPWGDWNTAIPTEGGATNTKDITVVNRSPYTPSNPSPTNHATGVSIYTDLSWSGGDPDAGDTVTYDVYFGVSSPPPLVSNDQSATTYDPGTLSHSTKYYWKIIATDNNGASSEGPIWDFTTESAPPPPNQPPTLSNGYVTPSSGDISTIFEYYVTYADPDGDAPTVKYVYVDGSPYTMTKISGDYVSGATFKYSTTLPEGSHSYYFYFDDGYGHTVRLPTSGTYSGPNVSPPPAPDFSISASPNSLTIQQGNSDTSTITITSINGFDQPVQLSVSEAPSGVTTTLSPEQVTPPAGGTATSTLTVSVSSTATPGSYTLTVNGASGALSHSTYISLEITVAPPPPNQPPYEPTAVSQYKSDGVTVIPEGGTTHESTVVFKATVSDPDGDSVRLEIELRQIGEAFTGEPTPETISDFVSSGSQVTITRSGLVNGDYHWRYRAKDSNGATSDWTEFGAVGNIDFIVPILIPGRDVPTEAPDFFPSVLTQLNIPISDFAVQALNIWTNYENTGAYWNPLATTWDMGEKSWNFNEAGVKNYVDEETGIQATANTLALHYYEYIREMLAIQSFKEQDLREAVATWSGLSPGDPYVVNLVNEWRNIYDIYWLAKAIMSEASVGTDDEQVAVGWTVINRLDSGRFGDSVEYIVKRWYAYDQEPTENIESIAKDILEREKPDPTDGATHFFSPRSMTSGYGPYPVPGTTQNALYPSWAEPRDGWEVITETTTHYVTVNNELEWKQLEGIRNWYFMFYRPYTTQIRAEIESPVELRVYDSQGRITGLVNETVMIEIPGSDYFENTVTIFFPNDTYRYEVAGKTVGSYGLMVTAVTRQENITFSAVELPTSAEAIHQYSVDWFALSLGQEGVSVQVDSNGDGIFEHTFTSDSELTQSEFLAQMAFYTFSIVWGEETFMVTVQSNSTVSNFAFNQPAKEISFNVTGEAGTVGFCNVTIPKQLLLGEPWTVLVDAQPATFTQTENDTHTMLYFTYGHSTHRIQIIGTWVIGPPPDTTPPLIDTPFQEPEPDKVTPDQAVTVSVNVTDMESSVESVILSYTTNGGATWNNITMLYNATTMLYQAAIPAFPSGTTVCYKIIAYDNAGNFAINDNAGQYYCYTVSAPVPPLSASINPLSASILAGESVTFTSTVSGGYPPYSYQWYLNGNPVSGATSNTWTFTPTTSGIYYVYLKITDDTGNTTQSETARVTVASVPVGGYSIPINKYTIVRPILTHTALIVMLAFVFVIIRRKNKRKTK